MNDLSLITAIKNNDRKAFEGLFNKYYSPLVSYINTFTNDIYLSEDIVQQTFIVLWDKRLKLNITKSPKSYLYSVAYNMYIDHYRKLKKQDLFFDELRESALRSIINEDDELAEKRIKKLKTIVENLPPRCKKILQLNKLSGLKYKEISVMLGISQKTVEAQMRIAFQKIRKGFESDKLFFVFINKLFPPFKG